MSYVTEKVCVFTCTNEEDAQQWTAQYLAEIERLGLSFVMHFDRCELETRKRIFTHPLCVGYSEQNRPQREYTEMDKQECFNKAAQHKRKYHWAFHLDMDETLEKTALDKLASLEKETVDLIGTIWANIWERSDQIRVSAPFGHPGNPRVKLYNLQGDRRWKFDHPVIYGCKLMDKDGNCPHHNSIHKQSDLVVLHWGLMNHDLRVLHRDRWDRIYGRAVGENPYQMWANLVATENEQHDLIPNPYI